ncbi:unnamed protein product [Phytomonas sp. EM1]|nr:unnamed protein product [Phytomonas sp. EM1]|eukprot:CCW62860.1 unnamed protein product [Phytomonas sp. isolate EM1]
MGSTASREYLSPYEINTPLIGISFISLLFNSVENGVFRVTNLHSNALLCLTLCVSTGCTSRLNEPLWGARLGFSAAFYFTFAPYLKLLYTKRLFPDFVRIGIGSFYMSYHMLQWYTAKYHFEDAHEDYEDEDY